MSQSANAQADQSETPALGARDNFWGESLERDTHTERRRQSDLDRDWGARHSFTSGVSKYEYVAHAILKESGASFLCPVCLFGDEEDCSDVSDLSDPELYVPKEFPEGFAPRESNQYRHRRRYCHDKGHVSFGGKLANRPRDEFMDVVNAMLEWVLSSGDVGLRESDAEFLREKAHYLKMDRGTDDTEIIETLLQKIDTGEME